MKIYLFTFGDCYAAIAAVLIQIIYINNWIWCDFTVYIYEPLMDLKTLLSGVPWDIVLLYGGGMAVAEGCKVTLGHMGQIKQLIALITY